MSLDRDVATPEISVAYWDHPDQVIWIDLPGHRLQGFDNYWIDWPFYGMFQDDENMGTLYPADDIQGLAYEWGVGYLDDWRPPPGVHIYRGYMLNDEQARFVGLI